MQKQHGLRSLAAFLQFVLVLAFVVLALVSGLLAYKHRGMSTELAQALGLLLSCLALLLVTERLTTGRWTRWSRR
ncbi:hypothetical protein OG730_41695 (plasmid) [Streptomyces sp. NBC_01298]|uniref:hypothetical protein n=1 Tax=Streptomyces sp. NBC_01298 TaxID=2903817 RepID=UPI002E104FCB|nr:hypothetical protein OG730_41695 [Streptomyces sp. NBC_01298]